MELIRTDLMTKLGVEEYMLRIPDGGGRTQPWWFMWSSRPRRTHRGKISYASEFSLGEILKFVGVRGES